MGKELIWFVVAIIAGVVIIIGFILQDIYLMNKIRRIEKQNAKLRRDNIGLMKHNGKLFDENMELKNGVDSENIPSFKKW